MCAAVRYLQYFFGGSRIAFLQRGLAWHRCGKRLDRLTRTWRYAMNFRTGRNRQVFLSEPQNSVGSDENGCPACLVQATSARTLVPETEHEALRLATTGGNWLQNPIREHGVTAGCARHRRLADIEPVVEVEAGLFCRVMRPAPDGSPGDMSVLSECAQRIVGSPPEERVVN